MRQSITISDEIHNKILIATANMQIKSLKKVGITDFINEAILEKLAGGVNGGLVKESESTSDAVKPKVQESESVVDDNTPTRKKRTTMTPEIDALVRKCTSEGMTIPKTMVAADVCSNVVSGIRKKMEEEKNQIE